VQLVEGVTNEEQEGYKNCLCVKLMVKRMLIEMLLLISLTGLWDIFPTIGEDVVLRVTGACTRCVMTTNCSKLSDLSVPVAGFSLR
jgi:hypothetical protein